MHKLFNNILIPVTFSSASDRLVEKGVEFANLCCCNIHLLHITSAPMRMLDNISRFYQSSKTKRSKSFDARLNKLVEKYRGQLQNGLKIVMHTKSGNRNLAAIDYIMQNNIDLVLDVLPVSKFRPGKSHLDANKIASKTNAAVITIPEYRKLDHLYSMVIPVTDFMPLKKLMYGIYLAKQYNTTIHLLGIADKQNYMETKRVQKYLQRSYQLIQDNCNVPTDMTIKDGQNITKTVKEYAANKDVDLVIINSEHENHFGGMLPGFLTGFSQKKNSSPILTIGQAN